MAGRVLIEQRGEQQEGGPGWGQGGYFWMPYAYLLDDNLANDFWTIRTVA